MKALSEKCKTGSITVLKIRLAGYIYRRFFGLKSVSRLTLRQRRRRRRLRRTSRWQLWWVLCYYSTFFVFLVTFVNCWKLNQILRSRAFLTLLLSLWVYWGNRSTRRRLGGANVCKFVTLFAWEFFSCAVSNWFLVNNKDVFGLCSCDACLHGAEVWIANLI